MRINKCIHNAFHDILSKFAQAHNTTVLNSRSLKMTVFQGFVKYEHFLPGSCMRVDKRH